MPFTDPLKELVLQGASAAEIKTEMIRGGTQSPAHGRHREDPRRHDHARRGPAHHGGRLTWRSSTCRRCSRRCSTRARRISTSPPARRRGCASTASSCGCRPSRSTPVDTKHAVLLGHERRAEAALRGRPRDRLLVRHPRPRALPRERLHAAGVRRRRVPPRAVSTSSRSKSSACRRSSTELCEQPRGLVLVTGPTGSGKSTTLASMIDRINTRDARSHRHDRGSDRVPAPAQGVPRQPARDRPRHAVVQARAQVHPAPGSRRRADRRDARPRDDRGGADRSPRPATSRSRTLHTNSAIQSINRIIDVFPSHQQAQIRAVLSFVLEGVITQTLIPKAIGLGPRARRRGDGAERRDPEPDPRGQAAPDLLADADRPDEVRHADDEPVAVRPVHHAR